MKNLTLEKINKNLLLLALALLLFRTSSFAVTHIPQPFELCFSLVCILTLIDFIWNKRFSIFFGSFPKRLWISSAVLFLSVLVGWLMAIGFRDIVTTTNTLFEFGAFVVAFAVGVLVFYYSKHDQTYIKKCLYVLCIPAVYSVCIISPHLGETFGVVQNGTFRGFTDNVNIISKALLIPLMFFVANSLVPHKNNWHRIGFIIMSVLVLATLFWTTERATVVAYVIGTGALWLVISLRDGNWTKICSNALIITFITVLGFVVMPGQGKRVAIGRILHFDGYSQGYDDVKDKSIKELLNKPVSKKESVTFAILVDPTKSPEPRFQLWQYYGRLVWNNPLGLGPNTHMPVIIHYAKSHFVNPGPHNTYLEIWMWGGILGLFSFLYIIWSALKTKLLSKNLEIIDLALFGSLVAFLVAIFFNDGLQSYWFWVLLALSLGKK